MRLRYTILVMLFILLTACSTTGDGAKLVAAFPRGEGYPGSENICTQAGDLCHAYMAISSSNPARTAGQAEDLAERYYGYRVDKEYWPGDGGTGNTLVLAVPVEHFNSLLRSLRRLGTVEHEILWSEWSDGYGGAWSRIVLDIRPRRRIAVNLPEIHWNPLDTFTNALQVSFLIFRTLVDVLIWVLVVAGPFVLIWMGIRALVRRLRT